MKTVKIIIPIMLTAVLVACSNKTSLEEFYVNNQYVDGAVVLNLPSSMLTGGDDKKELQAVEKANIIAFPLNESTKDVYKKKKEKVESILKHKEYKLLMKSDFRGNDVSLYYVGDSDKIDEMILYGAVKDRGFGVARILGDDMNPKSIIDFFKGLGKQHKDGNIKSSQIESIMKIFGHGHKDEVKENSQNSDTLI